MRRRHDRNRLLRDVNAVAQARLVDVRKPLDDEPRRFVRDVQPHVFRAALFHLAVNRARHHVARRERFQRMIGIHEFDAVERFEHAAFAAHGFADEK